MKSEPWEYDFANPPRIPPPSLIPENLPPVPCEFCLKTTHKPHYVVKHFGLHTKQMAFCDEQCEHGYYLGKLRGSGI